MTINRTLILSSIISVVVWVMLLGSAVDASPAVDGLESKQDIIEYKNLLLEPLKG